MVHGAFWSNFHDKIQWFNKREGGVKRLLMEAVAGYKCKCNFHHFMCITIFFFELWNFFCIINFHHFMCITIFFWLRLWFCYTCVFFDLQHTSLQRVRSRESTSGKTGCICHCRHSSCPRYRGGNGFVVGSKGPRPSF